MLTKNLGGNSVKKFISGALACAALLSIGTFASADTEMTPVKNNCATYNVSARIQREQVAIDVVVPSKIEAGMTTSYLASTNKGFDIAGADTELGLIDDTLLAMDYYSYEYAIINNSEIPIKVFSTLSATTKGGTVLFDDLEKSVEENDKKNLRLWVSSSMSEGGSKAERDTETKKRIFNLEPSGDRNADILITKKAATSVLFESLDEKVDGKKTDNTGYFRINGQAKSIPKPYWDEKDGVTIKFVLKIVPAASEE